MNIEYIEDIEGETQTINLILDAPIKESLKILVSLESRNGICVRDWFVKADIQCPNLDRLPLIDFNSAILIYFSAGGKSWGILNFSEPAKSTILN